MKTQLLSTIIGYSLFAVTTPRAPELVVPAKVIEVYDGDTVTCEFKLRARVRLLECWAPELRDRGGRESRDHLKQLAEGKDCLVSIQLGDVDRLDDVLTFGRLLARITVDGQDVSGQQVRSGHATESRAARGSE